MEKKKGRRNSRLLLFNSMALIRLFFLIVASLQIAVCESIFCHANHSELILYKFILERIQLPFRTIIIWYISEMVFSSLEITESRNNA